MTSFKTQMADGTIIEFTVIPGRSNKYMLTRNNLNPVAVAKKDGDTLYKGILNGVVGSDDFAAFVAKYYPS